MICTDSLGRRNLLAEHANTITKTAAWRYEDPGTGETFLIECICGHWQVSLDVWNEVDQDWDGMMLDMTAAEFLKEHNIYGLVS